MLSPPQSVGVSGALVSLVALWARFALGIVPRRVLCAAGGGAAVWRLAGSRRDQTVGKNGSHFGMRVQVKCACVRPDRGSLTSHQDRTA